MESYPGEFVFHHYPLMAVMGLGAHKDIENSISPPSSPNQPKSPASRRSSTSAPTHSISTRLQLSRTLLNILLAKGQDTVWEPPKHGNLMFRVVALEKNHQFPVKKTGNKAVSSHSSLSPMTPDSPLYPDGLITPIWVKKHREVAPSVVVGFYDLWEWSMGGVSIDEKEKLPHVPEPLGNINPIEREKDTDLVAEINERKKTIIDRGIKFTVVILLRSQHVDDSNIDERLNYIKKMCSLEGKNMFFVLPPSSQNELQEFATNLQKSLYDHALAYYRELSKRIKKKRSRLPSTTSAPNVRREEKSDNTNQPLIVQGWMVRYDYKMAMFAEFRQEIDSAVKYYISAYDLLVDMFAPVPLITPNAPRLTPRTKRWAEAKVLADSMNLKICKLYLYLSGYTQSVSHLNKHVSTFHGLSDSFHMGKDTFEYWTWKTKQYRLYGDLLDIAVRNGFKIPSVETWTNTYESRGAGGSGYGSGAASGGVDPRLILQHAGFYYHQAAMCNIERRKKFLAVETLSKESPDSPDLPPQASLTAERSVDHSALTIELLTKSYEQFKKYKSGRMTLYLASEIAGTYYDVNKYEMALRQAQATHGRWCSMSTKTYRKESWHTVLESILRWSLKCAKEIGSWDTAIEIMVELLSDRFTMSEEARLEIQNDLKSILSQPNNPSSTLRIDMDQINSFVTVHFQFKRLTTFVGTSTPFQLSLGTSHTSPPVPFQLSFIRLIFSDPYFNHYIRCGPITDSEKSKEKLQYLDIKNLKQEEVEETGVVWAKDVEYEIRKNSIVVFEGLVVPKESGDLTLMSVCLGTVTSSWKVELNFSINEQGEGIQRRKWMELGTENEVTRPKFINLEGSGDRPSIKVIQKQAKIDFKASHHPPALLNEMYPIELKITNNEPEEVRVIMNAEIMAADAQASDEYITCDSAGEEISSPTLKDTDLGVIQSGESITKVIYVAGANTAISRTLQISLWYAITSSLPTHPPPAQGWIEKQEDIRIQYTLPFDITFVNLPQSAPPEYHNKHQVISIDRIDRYHLIARVENASPWILDVESVELITDNGVREDNVVLEVVANAAEIEETDQKKLPWKPGYIFQGNYLLGITIPDITSLPKSVDIGVLVIKWRRQGTLSPVKLTTTTVPVTPLLLQQPDLSAVISIPPTPKVGHLFTLTYTLYNQTPVTAEISVSVEVNEAFVFSGYKQTFFRVLPFSEYEFRVNCFPLGAGKIRLPKAKFVNKKNEEEEIKVIGTGVRDPNEDEWYVVFVKPKTEF